MKLDKRQIILVSFMLFSLFFGAGNLIFPPFLGQNAGNQMILAMGGFLITAVVLPILGVIVVARFGGLDYLGQKVGKHFGLMFAVVIYLAIGPGLGIPRAASVPFEMAVAPYLSTSANTTVWMMIYSFVFFLIALWLCLTPNKLVERVGRFLTPSLLILLLFLFLNFLIRGNKSVADAQMTYQNMPFLQGFAEGYNTMDAIAALNFGLVIATTLKTFGCNKKQDIMKYTLKAGCIAGTILAMIYIMLSYMGMCSSGVYELHGNGAWTLRCIVYQLFGDGGAFLLASIFTLACLTTCVGLINSISLFFSQKFTKVNYRAWVLIIVCFSFVVCNLGLNTILSVSVPILNAIYPISIVLILLGVTDTYWEKYRYVYPVVITGTSIVSIVYALEQVGFQMPVLSNLFTDKLPLYSFGYGWIVVSCVLVLICILLGNKRCK